MGKSHFDPTTLYIILDHIRVQRGLLWRDVAREAGVASSMFSRMRNGRSPDLNGFSKVCWWAKLDANEILGVMDVNAQQNLTLAISGDNHLTKDQKHALSTIVWSFYVQKPSPKVRNDNQPLTSFVRRASAGTYCSSTRSYTRHRA